MGFVPMLDLLAAFSQYLVPNFGFSEFQFCPVKPVYTHPRKKERSR
jgi:hypothetical protein